MATGKSGSLTWTSGTFTLQINWSETFDISTNTSDVTINSIQVKSSSYYQWQYYPNGTIQINGTTVKTVSSAIPTGYVNVVEKNTFYTVKTGTSSSSGNITCSLSNIAHNTDGTKSITIEPNLVFYTTSGGGGSGWKATGAKSIELTTIPRASTLDSLSCSTSYFDGTLTYKYTPQSASFYNKMDIYIKTGSDTYAGVRTIKIGKKTAAQQTATVTLSSSELSTIYGKLPTATKGTLRFTLRTYSDSGYATQIGNMVSKDISLTIPTSVVPKLGTITLDPVNITTSDGTSRNLLVQEKNKIKVSISECEAGSGSSIKSYTFAVLSGSTTIASTTTTSTSATFGPFTQTGSLKFRVTVTDNRSRSTNNSGSELTQTCHAYDTPSFSSFTVYRCNSSGAADDNGTNVKYSLKVSYSSIKNASDSETNNSTVKIYYKKSTDSSWKAATNALTSSTTKSAEDIIKDSSGTITFDANATYLVYATITDNYSGSTTSSTTTIFGASRIFNIRSNGTGIAFGKMAESDNLLESKWPAKFDNECTINGDLTIGTSTQSSTPTVGIKVHDVRNADIVPDSFGDKNINFYFDQVDNRWMSVLHMKGWTGNYAAWELAGNAHNSSSDNTLKYRQGLGDTWGDWQTVITDKNIANYKSTLTSGYLPLSGGTLTGSLQLPSNYFLTNSLFGIDCNNSDIIDINGLYFADSSDAAGEGINFKNKDGTTWDTLYTLNGALKYHPARSTSTSLAGYVILNGNNFRRGTCTLSSSTDTTVTFSSALGGTPTVMLTPLTTTSGVIPGKVKSVSSTGFTAVIGGSAVSSAKFAYLAMYN